MANVDYFLKFDGIEGESEKSKGEIDLESFSWGQTNAGSAGHGPGGGSGKVSNQDFHITKKVDKSTPNLMLGCAAGKHLKFATLSVRKAGGKQECYLTIKMEDAFVSSYQIGGSGGEIVPMEQISINFAKVKFTYKPQKADGSLGGAVEAAFDFLKVAKV